VHQSGERDYYAVPAVRSGGAAGAKGKKTVDAPESDWVERMQALRQEMFLAAENLEFEKAARLRDELRKLQGDVGGGASGGVSDSRAPAPRSRAVRGGRADSRAPRGSRSPAPAAKKRARR